MLFRSSFRSLVHLILQVDSALSPLSLHHLAEHCSHLLDFRFWTVSQEKVAVTALPPYVPKSPHPLRSFLVADDTSLTEIDNSPALRDTIRHIFPAAIIAEWKPFDSVEDLWRRVGLSAGWDHPCNDNEDYWNRSPGDLQILAACV